MSVAYKYISLFFRLYQAIIVLGLVLFSFSCTEVYTPDLDADEDIIYIEGGITNMPGPHVLNLRYVAGYNDKSLFEPATGATLFLEEEGEVVYQFEESSGGVYITDSMFRATPGRTYRLIIETPDGDVYESTPQVLPVQNVPIDTIYGIREIKNVKYYNVYGEFVLQQKEINQIYADIPSASENTYYRFDCQLVLEHAAAIEARPGSPEPDLIPVYLWDSFYPEDLAIIEVNAQREKLRKFPLTHTLEDNEEYSYYKYRFFPEMQAEYDARIDRVVQIEVETDSGIIIVDTTIYGIEINMTDPDYYYGWFINVEQYSITRDAHTYWSDIQKLEESEGEIFDPIATQLRGNMTCTNNEDKIMLGLFEVASKRETPAFVNYISDNGIYLGKLIEFDQRFPTNGWNDTIPPDFWVDKVFSIPNKSTFE